MAFAARSPASRRSTCAESIDKRQLRFMGPTAAYAYLAMEQAVADSGLEESDVSNDRTGIDRRVGRPLDVEPLCGP